MRNFRQFLGDIDRARTLQQATERNQALAVPRCSGNSAAMNTLLSIGHGYSAQALSRRLIPQGWRVIGTTRTVEKAALLRAQGVEALIWPGDISGALRQATHLLSSVAPDAAGDPVVRALGARLAGAGLHWAGYLSTTAVYGHHNGDWVDEETALTPTTARGAARVRAEAAWGGAGPALAYFPAGRDLWAGARAV